MEIALSDLQWKTCLVYFDDVVVFAPDFDSHMQRVKEVLDRIKDSGFKLKPDKCQLLQKEVNFLGHTISEDGVKPNFDNVAKLYSVRNNPMLQKSDDLLEWEVTIEDLSMGFLKWYSL